MSWLDQNIFREKKNVQDPTTAMKYKDHEGCYDTCYQGNVNYIIRCDICENIRKDKEIKYHMGNHLEDVTKDKRTSRPI